jgi:hypothetical protein
MIRPFPNGLPAAGGDIGISHGVPRDAWPSGSTDAVA